MEENRPKPSDGTFRFRYKDGNGNEVSLKCISEEHLLLRMSDEEAAAYLARKEKTRPSPSPASPLISMPVKQPAKEPPISDFRRAVHPFVCFPMLAAAMLVWAISDEHGWRFYSLLRWVCFAAFLSVSKATAEKKTRFIARASLVGAVVFNPFFTFHFGRDSWIAIDAAAAMLLIVGSWASFNTVYRKDR